MEYRSSFHPSASSTPLFLKILLAAITAFSLFSSWLIPYLALSLRGIENGFIWQLVSYALIHPFPIGLFQMALNLYLIWIFGASLIERIHTMSFFVLYFGAALSAGSFALLGMYWIGTLAPLMGSSPALFALLISWTMLNSEAELFLFFTLRFKARHLILALIGISFLVNLSHMNWIALLADTGTVLFGYLFTLIACRVRSPFTFLWPFENFILRALEKLGSFKRKPYLHTKIYDIHSGEPVLNDDQFMDAMLARISLYGEDALKPEEKQRMQRISEKRTKKKKI